MKSILILLLAFLLISVAAPLTAQSRVWEFSCSHAGAILTIVVDPGQSQAVGQGENVIGVFREPAYTVRGFIPPKTSVLEVVTLIQRNFKLAGKDPFPLTRTIPLKDGKFFDDLHLASAEKGKPLPQGATQSIKQEIWLVSEPGFKTHCLTNVIDYVASTGQVVWSPAYGQITKVPAEMARFLPPR